MKYKEKSFWLWYDWIFQVAVAVNYRFGKGVYSLGEHIFPLLFILMSYYISHSVSWEIITSKCSVTGE